MTKLRVLDLFSGIGGFSLGLERTGGFETVAFCEISPSCRHLLNHHWPDVPQFEDVCTLTRGDIDGPIDVICGGFPCQDLSFAGKGAGLAGARSGLWSEYARIVGEFRPRFVIVENVSALLVRGFGTVAGDLAALGYDLWWDCIPASAVGAPHIRDRLWIVAFAQLLHANDAGPHRAPLHVVRGSEFRDQQERFVGSVRSALANTTDDGIGRGKQQPEGREGSGNVADAQRAGLQSGLRDAARQTAVFLAALGSRDTRQAGSGWFSEPDVGRVAHGVPSRVDRLHGLGNAVVPQIPEIIGHAILSSMAAQQVAA